MREGSGEVEAPVAPHVAFTYLADPRHAPRWFAGVECGGRAGGATDRRVALDVHPDAEWWAQEPDAHGGV